MKKKNIEKVFREKLQDYGQIPEEHIWKRISDSLDEKKDKRRILPFWWRIAGVAALLIAALFIFLPEKDLPAPEIRVSDTDQVAPSPSLPVNENKGPGKTEESKVAVSTDEPGDDTDEIPAFDRSDAVKARPLKANGERFNNTVAGEVALQNSDPRNASDVTRGQIADLSPEENSDLNSPSPESADIPAIKGGEEVVQSRNAKNLGGENAEKNIAKPEEDLSVPKIEDSDDRSSIFEAIADQEDEILKEKSSGKWEVGPRVAPVYFSSLSQGSPIHSSFRDNTKSGNVNMSYGVAVTYAVGKRMKIRSGVHRVDFGYDTQDVSFSSSLNANTNGLINNIDYSLSSRNLVVRSNSASGKIPSASAQDFAGPDPSLNGIMIQEFGYLEVPLELTYGIIDRKIGVNLVGGVSSLFLLDNSVVLEANGNITEMGAANNINDLNFSTNFGVGFTYRLNDKTLLNLEPMFKYQLNTFSETSGNFQPFSMGIYSGLSFRF